MANHSYNPLNWDYSSGKTWSYMGLGALIGGGGAIAACVAGPARGGVLCGALGIGTGGAMGGAAVGLAGGMAGGFVSGVGFTALGGGNFQESLMGGVKGAAIGGAAGAVSGGLFGGTKAYLDGKNVWTGETIADGRGAFSFKNTPIAAKPETLPSAVNNIASDYNLNPNPDGGNVTLYRGTTGSENGGGPLFMTDNPDYAASYVANGGKVVEVTIPRSILRLMELNQVLNISPNLQLHINGMYGIEYQFHPSVKPLIVPRFK